jgi:hypothetical protein
MLIADESKAVISPPHLPGGVARSSGMLPLIPLIPSAFYLRDPLGNIGRIELFGVYENTICRDVISDTRIVILVSDIMET